MTDVTVKDIMAYFDMAAVTFAREWKKLTPTDKIQLKAGLNDGSLDY